MKHTVLIGILLNTLLTLPCHGSPAFERTAERSVILNPTAKEALEKRNPKWDLLKYDEFSPEVQELFKDEKSDSPVAFSSDFNHDGKVDLVVLVADATQIYALVLLATDSSYRILEIEKWKRAKGGEKETTYLSRLDKEEVRMKKGSKAKASDAIQIETYLGSVRAFFVKDNKILPYKGKMW